MRLFPIFLRRLGECCLIGLLMGGWLAAAPAAAQPAMVEAEAAPLDDAARAVFYRQLDLFGDVLEKIRRDYVDEPDSAKLIESALNGLVSSLDPHSAYLAPQNYDNMRITTRGKFGGLGIEVTMENGLVKVIAPIDDTPAQRAGIIPNDIITHLDGEAVLGLTLNQAVGKMRGEPGSQILLTVQRPGEEEPREIKITRAVITIHAVRTRTEGDGRIGYIRVTSFNQQAADETRKAIRALLPSAGAPSENQAAFAGFILDLRNNPGGLLSHSIAVADMFLSQGEIVSTRGRHPKDNQRYHAKPGDLSDGYPLIVLINGGSASASEIVAGALQDHRRAVIMGTASFGKGSVQTVFPLPNQGGLKLTTARYYTPSGRSIQARGITPDIIAKQILPPDFSRRDVRDREADLRNHLPQTPADAPAEPPNGARAPSDGDTPKDDASKSEDGGAQDGDAQDGGADDNGRSDQDAPDADSERNVAYIPPDASDDAQLQAAIRLLKELAAAKDRQP